MVQKQYGMIGKGLKDERAHREVGEGLGFENMKGKYNKYSLNTVYNTTLSYIIYILIVYIYKYLLYPPFSLGF